MLRRLRLKWKRKCVIFCIILLGCFLIFFCCIIVSYSYYYDSSNLKVLSIHQIQNQQQPIKPYGLQDKKIILLAWNGFTDTYPYYKDINKICPKCFFTEDMEFMSVSDGVVFHGKYHPMIPPISQRHSNQIWIWYYLEPPPTITKQMRTSLYNYQHLFNWTMTYRHDSDIFIPYGRFIPFTIIEQNSTNYEEKWAYKYWEYQKESYNLSLMPVPKIEELKNRKMAAWIVSNCESNSKRHWIVNELKKYIDIDIYGNCGTCHCPSPRSQLNHGMDCRLNISNNYKFYLAFENSLCHDYITEKYFRTLFTSMIPIVYGGGGGGGNYNKFIPKDSYINVIDFNNIKDLAHYIIYLDSNPIEYLKYFEWRKYFIIQNIQFIPEFCSICDKLWEHGNNNNNNNNSQFKFKTYPDLIKWWTYKSDYDDDDGGSSISQSICMSPTQFKTISNTWSNWWFWF